MDQRTQQRFPLKLKALVSRNTPNQPDDSIEVLTKDISCQGAYLEMDNPLMNGSEISLQLFLPISEMGYSLEHGPVITASGAIVRHGADGVGVQFDTEAVLSAISLKHG